MSKIKKEIFGGSMLRRAPNVFIGNAGHILTNEADVINAFTVPELAVYNFRVDENNNVSFHVGRDFQWERGEDNSGWLYQNSDITYFYDLSGHFKGAGTRFLMETNMVSFISISDYVRLGGTSTYAFNGSQTLKNFYMPGSIRHTSRDFQNCPVPLLYLPNVTELSQTFYRVAAQTIIYIGNYQGEGMGSTNMFNQIYAGSIIYFHPMFLTSNNGGLAQALAYAESEGAILRPVHNKILPNPITDLSISNITSNSVQVNFTMPTETENPIDFFEVWLQETSTLDIVGRYCPKTQKITASGQVISGLKPNTNYELKLATIDTMYNGTGQDMDENRRVFSNQVIFQTQSI